MRLLFLWLPLCVLAACIPHNDHQATADKPDIALLQAGDSVGRIQIITGKAERNSSRDEALALVSERIRQGLEKRLQDAQRWKPEQGLPLYIEVRYVRLRHNLTVLFLPSIGGRDELSVRAWVADDDSNGNSAELKSGLDAGGSYATLPVKRRLELLADQMVNKLSHRF